MQGTGNTFSETRTCIFFPVPYCCITLELSLRMEGSGSAWQNPFPVSRRNQKIQPWEPAPKASTGFGSLCWDSLLWWVENHLPYLHFFMTFLIFYIQLGPKFLNCLELPKILPLPSCSVAKQEGKGLKPRGKEEEDKRRIILSQNL